VNRLHRETTISSGSQRPHMPRTGRSCRCPDGAKASCTSAAATDFESLMTLELFVWDAGGSCCLARLLRPVTPPSSIGTAPAAVSGCGHGSPTGLGDCESQPTELEVADLGHKWGSATVPTYPSSLGGPSTKALTSRVRVGS
jgi:hypothetical protein